MTEGYKKIILPLLAFAASAFIVCGAAFAADGDVPFELSYKDGSGVTALGAGFKRGADLWIPADAARRMGIPLRDGPNGKGFMIDVENPAVVFDAPELAALAGNVLPLYFASLLEEGTAYFNILGIERVTGIAAFEENGGVVCRKSVSTREKTAPRNARGGASGKILLAWAHITGTNPNLADEPKINDLDVLSPTWFNLIDANGGMANRASASYAATARERGCKVWAVVSNGFSKTLTTQLFKNPRAAKLFIARILAYSTLYGLDGINLDFENVDPNDGAAYVKFVAKLAPYLRARGLTLSVDVHVPGNSGAARSHDRGSLAKYVDYVMLMAYDEHWRTSPKAGSVASLPWVERAVQGALAEGVPPGKLVLGVPFYMRKWEETQIQGGKIKVKAATLTMPEADGLIASKGLSPTWLDDKGQYFFSYTENGKTYKVWMENEESLARKLALVGKYKLAGAAGWRKGHEKPQIWPVIKQILGK